MEESVSRSLSLVIAVAKEDKLLAEELKKHLQPLSDVGQLTYWFLDQIPPGLEPAEVIEEQCRQTNLFLMLLSADFFVSLDCQQITELAQKRESEGLARMFPIMLRAVSLEGSTFQGRKLLPRNEVPINLWSHPDQAWVEIINQIRTLISLAPQKSLLDPRNPYKGLRAFQPEDANDFFGRTSLIKDLRTKLKDILASDETRLLAVIGPSGVGKSSVVLAGLLPHLEKEVLDGREHWVILPSIKLGNNPLEALAVSLNRSLPQEIGKARIYEALKAELEADRTILHQYLSQIVFKQSQDSRAVLVIDQIEELFQPSVHHDDRNHFLSLLLETIKVKPGQRDLLVVVLTLRADFLPRIAAEFPEFYDLVLAHRSIILQMSPHEIREVIEEPAAKAQVQFDEYLVDDILQDFQEQSGSLLPLLQFTLEQLFKTREGYRLTRDAYKQIGGIKGAVEKQAEDTYKGLPDERHREWVKTIFLRLVNPGVSEQETTRKREFQTELLNIAVLAEQPIVQKCIDDFVSARLLTASEVEVIAPTPSMVTRIPTIEVSHEVVLREWQRLKGWISNNYNDLHFQQDFANTIGEWERHQQAPEWLYRGQRLREAEEWARRNRSTKREKDFLQASRLKETPSLQRKIMHWSLVIVIIALSIGGIWWWATHPPSPDPTRVTNTQDEGVGSLRWCLANAPANSTITVDPTDRGTIALNDTLTIDKSLTIKGPGENVLTLRGPRTGVGLDIAPLVTVSISAVSFTGGGSANATVGPITISVESASTLHIDHVTIAHNRSLGIENVGILVLSNMTISDNLSSSGDGGVANGGIMSITNSTITGNSSSDMSGASAGGIDNATNGNLTISNSTISHNSAAFGVGGVLNRIGGNTIISNSTITNNSSPTIGGVDNNGSMSITNSTISDNSAPAIGGVGNGGTMTIANSTLTNNSSPGIAAIGTEVGGKTILFFCTIAENPGKGIVLSYGSKEQAATVIMQDTILVSTSIVMQDPYSVFQSMGYNLVDTANAQFFQQAGDRIIQDPLGLFANGVLLEQNGGATQTLQIRAGSEAYNTIPVQDCHIQTIYDAQDHIYTDQRGQTRPGKGKTQCDIGAYEIQQ